MPLPAWSEGGRRTSVLGGTMLGLPKVTRGGADTAESAWQFARYLYFSRETAVALYEKTGIITPVRRFWSLPVFDKPNPYFCNQAVGRLFIQQAPEVPARSSSPYVLMADNELLTAYVRLIEFAEQHGRSGESAIRTEAYRLLAIGAKNVRDAIERQKMEER
jgi:arabinosaccharide transport system substrate-binding protein